PRRRADRVRRHPGRPGGGEVDADRRAPGGIRRRPSEGCPISLSECASPAHRRLERVGQERDGSQGPYRTPWKLRCRRTDAQEESSPGSGRSRPASTACPPSTTSSSADASPSHLSSAPGRITIPSVAPMIDRSSLQLPVTSPHSSADASYRTYYGEQG